MELFVLLQEEAADVMGEQVREEHLEFHWSAFLTGTLYFELLRMSLAYKESL